MGHTRGKWEIEKRLSSQMPYGIFKRQGEKITPIVYIQYKEDAHLISAAVNACQSVNQDNPMAVAESIKDMYEALKQVASIEQTTGKVCSLCGGHLDHKGDCLFILAEQVLAKAEGK